MKFSTIVIDPPWPYDKGPKKNGFSSGSYEPMSIEEIKNIEIEKISSENCHLYLWVTNWFLPYAFDIINSSGFRYVTMLTWHKNRKGGMGRYFHTNTEHVLFCIKGKLKTKKLNSNIFNANVTKHSKKPDEFFKLVEDSSQGPYLELFARTKREGWTCLGDEINNISINESIKQL